MKTATLLHQRNGAHASLLWVPPLSEDQQSALNASLAALRDLGYWASPFPEEDGVTFSHPAYNAATTVEAVQECFQWLKLTTPVAGESAQEAVQKMNAGTQVKLRYLVPVDKLLIDRDYTLGPYTLYRPVVPFNHPAIKHPQSDELLDISGPDIDPSWDPSTAPPGSLARLLGYPLIEGVVTVDAALLFPVGGGTAEWEPLALQVTEHADRAIDILRHRFCHYKKPHYTPQHAGFIAERGFREAYVIPERPDIRPHLVSAKARVFEAINVWLGLELFEEAFAPEDERLGSIAAGHGVNEIEGRIRSALRAKGQSFLLVNDEMRFVSMVFATDAIACVGRKTGEEHRKHVAAAASGGNQALYQEFLTSINTIYSHRNKIVHRGLSFIEMRVSPADALQKIDRILSCCLDAVLCGGWMQVDNYIDEINARIQAFEST